MGQYINRLSPFLFTNFLDDGFAMLAQTAAEFSILVGDCLSDIQRCCDFGFDLISGHCDGLQLPLHSPFQVDRRRTREDELFSALDQRCQKRFKRRARCLQGSDVHTETSRSPDQACSTHVHIGNCPGNIVNSGKVFDNETVGQVTLVNDLHYIGIICFQPDSAIVFAENVHE